LKTSINHIIKTAGLFLILLASLLLLSSCASSADWEGEWNRVGDATYSRSILYITDADSRGFNFSINVYNGNLSGVIENYRATFVNSDKTEAQYSVKDTDAVIRFIQEDGEFNVIFESMEYLESDVFDFSLGTSMIGLYEKGAVDYVNTSLFQMGVLTEEFDEMIQQMLNKTQYLRMMDCFQRFTIEQDNTLHATVHKGSMTDDEYGAVIICYEDGTVSFVMSGEKMLYYTTNSRFSASSGIYPPPIEQWLRAYEEDFYRKQNEAA
jgi:hypothetical protein